MCSVFSVVNPLTTNIRHDFRQKKEAVMEKINLVEKLSLVREQWSPKIIGEVNNFYVKLVKFKGEFVWHHHESEDELFLVIKGNFHIKLRDGDIHLQEGEMAIVPRGIEHLPIAEEEAAVLLLEPKSVLNTGNVKNDRTVENLERI